MVVPHEFVMVITNLLVPIIICLSKFIIPVSGTKKNAIECPL
jgi:hypothetical protein